MLLRTRAAHSLNAANTGRQSLPFSRLSSRKPHQVHLEPLTLPSTSPSLSGCCPASRATCWVTSSATCQLTNPLQPLTHSFGWASALLFNPKTAFSHSWELPLALV